MTEVDHIDVVGAQSVLEVAEVIAAILGARMEMGSEPGRIVVTGAPILIFGLSSGWRSTTAGYPKGGPDESRSPTLAVATNAVAGHRTYTAPSPNAATGHLPPREDHPDGALPAEGSDDRRVRALARICRPTDGRLPTLRWSMPGVMSDVPATGRARNRARRVREPINGSAGRLVVRSQPTMESTSSGGRAHQVSHRRSTWPTKPRRSRNSWGAGPPDQRTGSHHVLVETWPLEGQTGYRDHPGRRRSRSGEVSVPNTAPRWWPRTWHRSAGA